MKNFYAKSPKEHDLEWLERYGCSYCGQPLQHAKDCGYLTTSSDWVNRVLMCTKCQRLNIFEVKIHPLDGQKSALENEVVQYQCTYDLNAGKRENTSSINVSCALIEKDNSLLLCKRGEASHHPGKWEFPGGKQEQNENSWETLVREIDEELSIQLELKFSLAPVVHKYESHEISLQGFVCRIRGGKLNLREHSEAHWVKIYNLGRYDILAADIDVLEQYIYKRMSK